MGTPRYVCPVSRVSEKAGSVLRLMVDTHRKESPMAKKNENPSRKAMAVKKLASQKPRPLQEKNDPPGSW